MKKILLCSVAMCMGLVDTGFAAGSCKIRDLTQTEDPYSDEYLYVSPGHWRAGQVFACERRGDTKNCNNGNKIAVRGEHYIGKALVGATGGTSFEILECYARGVLSNDHWANIGTSSLKKCDKSSLKYSYVLFGQLDANNKVYCMKSRYTEQGTSAWCRGLGDDDICVSDDCPDCNGPDDRVRDCPDYSRHPKKRTKIPGTNDFYETKDCVDTGMIDCYEKIQDGFNGYWDGTGCVQCEAGSYPDHKEKKCVKNPTPSNCKASRSTAEGKACCDLPSNVAEWKNGHCVCLDPKTKQPDPNKEFKFGDAEGSRCVAAAGKCDEYAAGTQARTCCEAPNATWDKDNGQCNCGEGKKWVYDKTTNKGQCVDADDDDEVSSCYLLLGIDIKCNNGMGGLSANLRFPLTKTQADELMCKAGNAATKLLTNAPSDPQALYNWLNTYINIKNQLIEAVCGCPCGYIILPSGGDAAAVADAKRTLSDFFSYANNNKSVWKDAEGNFNTARLASDLTAGVVLGTVGGVVSGVVIKKKQVEKGFDALHCTVGGQTVADWGDTFNVGLTRY